MDGSTWTHPKVRRISPRPSLPAGLTRLTSSTPDGIYLPSGQRLLLGAAGRHQTHLGGSVMEDSDVLGNIKKLADEEHVLWEKESRGDMEGLRKL